MVLGGKPGRFCLCSEEIPARRHNLRKAETRQHIVEGLLAAMQNLDAVVALIRVSSSGPAASKGLQDEFALSPAQVCTRHRNGMKRAWQW